MAAMHRRTIFAILVAFGLGGMTSCQKEENVVGDAVLEFSCDTMTFDTVFTQMGSVTRQFKVYNRSSKDVRIGEVTLQQGRTSRFRLNVDGDTNMVARNIDIAAGDSIFVFVRANINPHNTTEPFLIEDAVLFRFATGAQQQLPLTAYGRDAVYHNPDHTLHYADGSYPLDIFGNPYRYSIIDCQHWDHSRPHVILGYAVVDSCNTLELTAGDELYFHNNAVLWVYDSASLRVQGSAERPVRFTSLRQDEWYRKMPGQWGYVWLSKGSWDNVIDHAIIENGYVGVMVDSCANGNPTLTISNTQIRNHSLAGLLGQTAYIEGDNLLISNCGTGTAVLQYGGVYRLSHSTFANYWSYEARTSESFFITNTYDYGGTHYVWPMSAHLSDCIIYGSRSSGELYLGLDNNATVDTLFHHCLIRGGTWDEDPQFVDPAKGDYHLKESSPAIGIGYTYDQ